MRKEQSSQEGLDRCAGRPGKMAVGPHGYEMVTSGLHSSLATWESLFGLSRLADAATVPSSFGADVFTK
jgi:hypothetical protein